MTSLEYFRLLAPEYAAVDDATVGLWITMAEALANVACLDAERAAMAIALLAAHMQVLAGRGGSGATGAIVSEKEGDLSHTYAQSSSSSGYYGSTGYGQQYEALTAACVGASIMTRIG